LDAPTVAIWDNGVLTFKSFHLAKQIFDLLAYSIAATDEQIGQFASQSRFVCDNQDTLLSVCTQWHRKKIAPVLRSSILGRVDLDCLTEAGESVGYAVPMKGERIWLIVKEVKGGYSPTSKTG
jgi:hypothetical protein